MNLAGMFRNLGFTRNWQARCPSCNKAVSLSELGCWRDAPRGLRKHTLGWCRSCRALRMLHIEPVKPHASD